MLTYWIPEGPSMLPSNASHQVGVGGFVINDKNEGEESWEAWWDEELLQDNSKSSSGEVEVKFQLTKDTLDAMLRSMTYINDHLSGMVYIEMHFFGTILDNIDS
ncbi:uncharacterized protein LOC133782178 isoform X1 [Humulus lupulus]|uniref:uncharacterized protein LOC133782178 isoform X1 n=1 Tax=Humulus lupulus TaxID=3486 RepID=UPI002B40B6F5|nr:uncharacterized protein LOC133782178 isoform X1 [Humulus lupulus]XP_062077376.1 uncharacterized protein LOC133782178 isoform X1 [Humulus lupulus]